MIHASDNCLRLLRQTARLPCSLTRFRAGINIVIQITTIAITTIAITTKKSVNVNRDLPFNVIIVAPARNTVNNTTT
jgi:hypothetical protein